MEVEQLNSINSDISDSVHFDYDFDSGPGKYRIGLLALSNDLATERDFVNMGVDDELITFVSRIPNEEVCSVENLKAMEPEITKSASLLIPGSRLDVVAYSCTSGTVVLGFDTVVNRIQIARPEIPVVTPITSSMSALNHFSANKISVLTPYTDDVNMQIANHLTNHGFEILAFTSFKLSDNSDMAALPPGTIYDAALQADHAAAQALFISCTAIRAVDVVEDIEKAIGKPVVTANQALFWQSVRAAGYDKKIDGYGSLLHRMPTFQMKEHLGEIL